MIHRGK